MLIFRSSFILFCYLRSFPNLLDYHFVWSYFLSS
uniref:Uncharacterized protein n=1 Tax=Arundo donax TaxID=35708 RepID=A0A0A9ARM5_ARUDO